MSEENYQSFLESETSRMNKATRTTWIAGGVILLFLIGYFSFILTMVKTFTEPENAAFLVADNVKTNFPSFIETTEAVLAERSVYLADDLSSTFLNSVPMLREEAQAQIDLSYTEMIPHVSGEFQLILTNYIEDHKSEIKVLAEQGDSEAFTEAFVAEVMNEFGAYMDDYRAESFDGRDLKFIQENTLVGLQAMNVYLGELMTMPADELTRIQSLQKNLLAAVTRRVIEE